MESSGSRRYSGKLFQVVGPATANERGPYVDNLTGGTIIISKSPRCLTRYYVIHSRFAATLHTFTPSSRNLVAHASAALF